MCRLAFIITACLLFCFGAGWSADYPTGKLVIADYQGGRATRSIGGTPGIWTYDGNALQSSVPNKRRVSNSDLLDANDRNQIAAMAYPAVGMQSQEDEDYLEYQILLAKAARIDGFVVEWSGPGDAAFLKMQQVAEQLGFYVGANWCVSQTLKWDIAAWETNTLKTAATAEQKLQFAYDYARRLKAELYDKPTGLRLNGRPLLLLFGGDLFANANLPQLRLEWGGGEQPLIGRYMLNLPDAYAAGVFRQAANLVDGFYPWSGSGITETASTDPELAPLMAVPTHDSFYSTENMLAYRERWIGYTKSFATQGLPLRMGCVMPGADNRACGGWGTKVFYLARNNGETHRRQWEIYASERENLDLVLVGTWNDFTEDTVIEPTLERGRVDVEIAEAGSAAFKGVPSDPAGLPLPKRLFDLRKGYGQMRRLGFTSTGPKQRMDAIAQQIAARQYSAAALALGEEEERLLLVKNRVTSQPVVQSTLVESGSVKTVAAGGNLWLTLPKEVDVLMSSKRCDTELTWEWQDTETTSYSVLATNTITTTTVAQIIGTGTGNWISARIRLFDENCPFVQDDLTAFGKALLRFSGKVTCRNVVLRSVRKDLPPSIVVGPVAPPDDGLVVAGGSIRLSIEAGATGGVGYQWRKEGVLISGATLDTLVIPSATTAESGSYDVVISGSGGSLVSAPARVVVKNPPSIILNPSDLNLTLGGSLLLSVGATGSEPLSYQWYRNNAPIASGTAASLRVSISTFAEAGTYRATVTGAGRVVTSTDASVTVTDPGISIIRQPADMILLRGMAATVTAQLSPVPGTRTKYELYAVTSGTAAAVPSIQGYANAESGLVEIPLRGQSSSVGQQYLLRFSRTSDGQLLVLQSESFSVGVRDREDCAGTYQAVLEDVSGPLNIPDGAACRGLITVTVGRSGTVSGNIQYNEACILNGTSNASLRTYVPVLRSFSSRLVPKAGSPNHYYCALNLGPGAGRQLVTLDLDLSHTRALLNVVVKDAASVGDGNFASRYCQSEAQNITTVGGSLGADLGGIVGAYVVSADATAAAADSSRNASLVVNVLPSGRVVWFSRAKGYSGSGSSFLNITGSAQPVAVLYERQVQSSSSSRLASTSLLGAMKWSVASGGSWGLRMHSAAHADRFEKQSTFLAGARDVSGLRWTGVSVLGTGAGDSCRWNAAAVPGLFPPGTRLALTAQDPLSVTRSYSWSVAMSDAGVADASGVPSGGVAPPPLTLRFDKGRGVWSGGYAVLGVRRTLTGIGLQAPGLRGRGWIEAGSLSGVAATRWELTIPE